MVTGYQRSSSLSTCSQLYTEKTLKIINVVPVSMVLAYPVNQEPILQECKNHVSHKRHNCVLSATIVSLMCHVRHKQHKCVIYTPYVRFPPRLLQKEHDCGVKYTNVA